VISTRDYLAHPKATSEGDGFWIQRELDEARKTIRKLLRQLDQERSRSNEIARAYDLTVANLVAITRENAALERERDHWRTHALGKPAPFKTDAGALELTAAEVSAIRKAVARIHHPDTGGDSERLKLWNATLDALEP
jgi:hypothetical protein